MSQSSHDDEDDAPGGSPRGALIALIAIVLLVAGGIFLARALHRAGRLQDCVMAGRHNCAPIAAPPAAH